MAPYKLVFNINILTTSFHPTWQLINQEIIRQILLMFVLYPVPNSCSLPSKDDQSTLYVRSRPLRLLLFDHVSTAAEITTILVQQPCLSLEFRDLRYRQTYCGNAVETKFHGAMRHWLPGEVMLFDDSNESAATSVPIVQLLSSQIHDHRRMPSFLSQVLHLFDRKKIRSFIVNYVLLQLVFAGTRIILVIIRWQSYSGHIQVRLRLAQRDGRLCFPMGNSDSPASRNLKPLDLDSGYIEHLIESINSRDSTSFSWRRCLQAVSQPKHKAYTFRNNTHC